MQSPAPSPALPGSAAPALVRHPVAWAVAIGTALRLALIALVPLTNDEAYHVDWTRHLQPGYLDHPPAVAWIMAVPLRLLGSTPLSVRLPALLLQTLALMMVVSLVRARAGNRAALAAAVGLQAAPLFSLGAALMIPDAPLTLAWVGTFWALQRALDRGARWALLAGAFLGLGALSKLTGGLLAVAVLAALVATRDGRRLLATPWPWLGACLAAALASPMLLWNASHGWPTFTFQARHGLSGGGFSLVRLLASLGGQLGYVSPVLLALSAVAAWRALLSRRDALHVALAFSALPVAAFFTLSAAFTPGALPHWPGPGWLSAMILLCLSSAVGTRGWRWALRVGFGELAVGLAALAILTVVPTPPSIRLLGREVPVEHGPLDDLLGWREGAAAARAVAGDSRLAVAHWIALGQLGWYDRRSPAYVGERVTGPSLYDPDPLAAGAPLLVVTVDRLGPQRQALERRLGPLQPAGEYVARQGERVVRVYRFWWRGAH